MTWPRRRPSGRTSCRCTPTTSSAPRIASRWCASATTGLLFTVWAGDRELTDVRGPGSSPAPRPRVTHGVHQHGRKQVADAPPGTEEEAVQVRGHAEHEPQR